MIIGIVGKANVGKSTFFKALTLAEVLIANYPFATIKPNKGFGHVRVECADKDFDVQCNPRFGYCIDHIRLVPVEVIDVAGLVPGAHEGKGLGNQFLDELRQSDALIHVIDASGSTNERGEPITPGSYDPADDIRFLEYEIDMWYLGILKKGWEKFSRTIQQEKNDIKKALAKQLSGLKVTETMVEEALKQMDLNLMKPSEWREEDLMEIAKSLRKKTKKMVIAANKIDTKAAQDNYERLLKEFPDHMILPCSAESELALKEAAKHKMIDYLPGSDTFKMIDDKKMNEKQKAALDFIKRDVLGKFKSTGVQDVMDKAVFDLLGYIAIFPGGINKLEDSDGNVLPDCFLMPGGTTALDFAYRLHTDFGKNFIKAIDVKKRRSVGKDHVLQHRDVIEIMSGK